MPSPSLAAPRPPAFDSRPIHEVAPAPASDEALRSSIQERFAGAYEAQLGYLSRVAASEQRWLQSDVEALRNAAYNAQRAAAEHRQRAEAARRALGQGQLEATACQNAMVIVRHELQQEAAALQACEAQLRHEEGALAAARARTQCDLAELAAQLQAAQQRRVKEEERAWLLSVRLTTVRAERDTEAKVAQEEATRAQAAVFEREQTLQNLRKHEALAVSALKDAVARMEADFAVERADFAERDRVTTSQLREVEQKLELRRRAGTADPGPPPAGLWAS